MGKAAQKRKNHRRNFLAGLSYSNPGRFAIEWEFRLNSWLKEIYNIKRSWIDGDNEDERLMFDVVDNAFAILNECAPGVRGAYAQKTFDLLAGECSVQISRVFDSRLCSLSFKTRVGCY